MYGLFLNKNRLISMNNHYRFTNLHKRLSRSNCPMLRPMLMTLKRQTTT